MLIIGRAIAGLGCSGIFNGSLTIIAASVPLEKRSSYVGVMLAFTQVTILAGPLIGGFLTQYTTWRWCFYLNLPAGALVACFFFITSIPQQNSTASTKDGSRFVLESLDLLGFFLFAPAAAMFLLATEWGGSSYSWNSAIIIGLFCGAGVAFIIFLGWEHSRGDAAMIPLRMLRKRVLWSSCLAQIFFSSGMYIVSYYIPIYFQAIKNASPTLSGVYMLPGIISTMIFTVISGILGSSNHGQMLSPK
jgi:MFS family permease